jgi:folate-binding protein YgfZ
MQTLPAEETAGYTAALEQCGYHLIEQPGCLRIAGADRIAFLQRQTTNDVRLVSETRSVLTVLTTPTARILDVLRVFSDEETLLALTLPGSSAKTAQYLRSRIFFMDKVSVTDASAEFFQLDLEGPQAAQALTHLQAPVPGVDHTVVRGELAGEELFVLSQAGLFAPGYRLVALASLREALQDRLHAAGVKPISPQVYQILRVEAGKPWAPNELSEEYTPLESGLEAAISSTKGCYTGQEVIARQITYDKITQRLAGLRLEMPTRPGEKVWAGERLVGEITSSAVSPRFGSIALGVLRKPHFEPGSQLRVGADASNAQPALCVTLPFSASENEHIPR